MFASLVIFAVVATLYGLIWHNLPSREREETPDTKRG